MEIVLCVIPLSLDDKALREKMTQTLKHYDDAAGKERRNEGMKLKYEMFQYEIAE